MQGSRNTANQGNMISPKEHNDFSVTTPKETDVYELPDQDLKIIVLRKLESYERT